MKIDRDKIVEILEQKNANKPCHRCGNDQFALIEDYSNIILQKEIGGSLVLGGPAVPVVLIACGNCGAITFHALGALGLLTGDE